MAIDIPWPKYGGISGGISEGNALINQALTNKYQNLKNQFYEPVEKANIASKLTYANLMGPQFLSKLFGNEGILANVPENQKKNVLQNLIGSVTGNQEQPVNSNNVLSNFNTINQASNNPLNKNFDLSNLSRNDKIGMSSLQPGQSYTIQGNQAANQIDQSSQQEPTYAENVGNYKGIVEEGKETGRIRAKDIQGLNEIILNGENRQNTFDELSNILKSKEFEQIRQYPIAGHHELNYYSKFGTPEQQQLVGKYMTLAGNIIKDSARDFPGAFRRGEQQLLNSMKPNPSDSVDVARGKLEALSIMNKLLVERSRLTSKLMSEKHFNKLQALEMADKQINGESIRNQIHSAINPEFNLPEFRNKEEFQSWYKKQPDYIKNKVYKKIGGT